MAVGDSNEIIQQRIRDLSAHNDAANSELNEFLSGMRDKLNANYAPQPQMPQGGPAAVDDVHYQRMLLYGSQWASEVIFAAVLDSNFKDETGNRAKEILREKGYLPPLEDPSPEGTGLAEEGQTGENTT